MVTQTPAGQNVKARCFEPLPDFEVALFHIDGQFFALQERCRHQVATRQKLEDALTIM